jgi:hypothetical protein
MKDILRRDAIIRKDAAKKRIQGNNSIARSEPIPSWFIKPKLANTPKSKTDVAFVGPRVMKRELENKLPTMAATAEPNSPYCIGNPDTNA